MASTMTSRARMLAALEGRIPDRLPVTTHHVMPYFLETYLDGISDQGFFDTFELDAICWNFALRPDESAGAYLHVCGNQSWICSDKWRISAEPLPDAVRRTVRYRIATPRKMLTTILQESHQSVWVLERLIKEKTDIELIAAYAPDPICDVAAVNRAATAFGDRGLVRGAVPSFEIYGQPGCWQDAAVLYGIETLILETYDDPAWVHALLGILKRRKARSMASFRGAAFDLIELGGGDASSTVISPNIFDRFVAPYDAPVIEEARSAGQRIVYHTCGGMMPLLERIADMGPAAMETFTPPSLGGDVDLDEAKSRIGERVCMIGGFDQCRFLKDCPVEQTRRAVRECFVQAGAGGGYILAPSDHFFDADLALLHAFAEEAHACRYEEE